MNHTPGPWHVTDGLHVDSEFGGVAIVLGGKGAGKPDDETAPNARLIAKAPEMRSHLEVLPEQFDAWLDNLKDGDIDGVLVGMRQVAADYRALLAEIAQGEGS